MIDDRRTRRLWNCMRIRSGLRPGLSKRCVSIQLWTPGWSRQATTRRRRPSPSTATGSGVAWLDGRYRSSMLSFQKAPVWSRVPGSRPAAGELEHECLVGGEPPAHVVAMINRPRHTSCSSAVEANRARREGVDALLAEQRADLELPVGQPPWLRWEVRQPGQRIEHLLRLGDRSRAVHVGSAPIDIGRLLVPRVEDPAGRRASTSPGWSAASWCPAPGRPPARRRSRRPR